MTSRHGTRGHTADLGLWVEADRLEELFSSAVAALSELMVRGPRQGELAWLPLALEGADLAELLVQLLNEVVYRLDGESLLAVALDISRLEPGRLQARLGVLPFDPASHRLVEPVKAVTYHQAIVESWGRGFRAQVVVDV